MAAAAAVEANIEYSKRLQSRLERVSQLAEFARDCGRSISGVLTELGWSGEREGLGLGLPPPPPGPGAEPPDPVVTCPFDVDHRLPKSSLEKHVASCRLRKLEYSREEEAEMCDPLFAYEKTVVPTFKMDKDLQAQIIQQAKSKAPLGKEERVFSQGDYSSVPREVPENHKRFICDLTPADRLAIYEHVVKETSQQRIKSIENDGDLYVDLAAKLSRDDEQKGPKSHLEILAEMRDYKRRRQSYRAKNVHITKKSYTEIIKDVISVHMEELSRQWKGQNDDGNTEEYDDQNSSLSLKGSTISRRRRSGDKRSPSTESQSTGSSKTVDDDRQRKNRSQSPHERKRSPDWDKERDSRKRREKEHHSRDVDRHRSYRRRK
ncbi:U11/U12 small nuclear ribonucleoprotein 48 kDa protein [Carcharodon carcharias]|uniref:U11/U12 small nuclear ribonucleoprotein 48 kDa protein n=1 Tax=Carcharodon carcharias TaxID=13397 RepID=UPI001B7EF2D4|nr:U11/U12 small nuclear ribonucleoprotein 48 kDa protein [Carcharodon carcharias]